MNLAGLIPGLIVAGMVVRLALVDVVPGPTPYDSASAKALVRVGAVTGLVYGAITAHWAARLFYCGDPDQVAGGR
jgi:hypothetical protein